MPLFTKYRELLNSPARARDLASELLAARESRDAYQRESARLGRELATRPKPVPPPFVAVLVQAHGPHGPTTVGVAKELILAGGAMLETRAQFPLWDVRITVFCDLQRVCIAGIFCGTDLITAELGSCPVAHVQRWDPGVWLRVQASIRTEKDS